MIECVSFDFWGTISDERWGEKTLVIPSVRKYKASVKTQLPSASAAAGYCCAGSTSRATCGDASDSALWKKLLPIIQEERRRKGKAHIMQLLQQFCILYAHHVCGCNAVSLCFFCCPGNFYSSFNNSCIIRGVCAFCDSMFSLLSIAVYYAEPILHSGMSRCSCCNALILRPLALNSFVPVSCDSD